MSLKIAQQIVEFIQQDKEIEIIEALDPYSLEQRRCIISTKHKRSSLLFIAVSKERVMIVTYFLESCGADPNSLGWMDYEYLSCLAMAIDVNSEIIVEILLEYGANTEVVSSYERTPLFHACCDGRESIIRLLIEHGANINSHNYAGETPLTELMYNLDLFKFLISKGADINSVDDFGQTALMVVCETDQAEIVKYLLSCENIDVRVKNDYGEDALHLSVRYCSEDIVQEIIRQGSYNDDEIIKVYELESCFSRVNKDGDKARELWEKALKLRSEPSDTTMFETERPVGKLQEVVDILHMSDISALCYLESVQELNSSFTLSVFMRAARNVHNEDRYISLCGFFFDTLHSAEDGIFFKAISQSVCLIRHYLYAIFSNNLMNLSRIFGVFVAFIVEIRLRLERMTPEERMPHTNEVESFLYFIIEMVCKIDERFPQKMDLFHEGITRILRTDLPGLPLKSLIQICACLKNPDRIITCFIRCGADANKTDKKGKTVLHEIVESDIPCQAKIVQNIIDNGFDFSRVRCDEYCLQCKMEIENIIPHSVKYISLQCLAARTLCENTMTCSSDVPHNLKTILDSHLFLS